MRKSRLKSFLTYSVLAMALAYALLAAALFAAISHAQIVVLHGGVKPASGSIPPDQVTSVTLKGWGKADNGTGGVSDGDQVTTWTDQSGNSMSPTQATSGNRPLYKTGIQNSKPGVLFDGSNDYLWKTSFTTISQPFSAMVVFKASSAGQDAKIFDADSAGSNRSLFGLQSNAWIIYAGSAVVSGGSTNTSIHVATMIFNGSSSQVWIDGASVISGSSPGTQGLDNLVLGAWKDGTTPFSGYIFEWAVFSGSLSTGDRTGLQTYARSAARWNF